MDLIGKILAGIQYLLPHHLLSKLIYHLMRIRVRWIKNVQIALISEIADVDWSGG